ncbi:lipoate--protein ligase family protein [Chitinispirillales bacterium ANBcel5]|uniref:lipoate--protein ligase family protein n=1 Tax=Cellulosispirillum alkaliphilum TaxID=3039283 RepID=UPI002A55DCF9|nr:lipoate--protein ligase family protein [Chitinispirillales bacterium ANBcel5]
MTTRLRIIDDSAHEPRFNMAADYYLLKNCSKSDCVNVRIYSWTVPSITLGYMQNAQEVLDMEAIKRDGVHYIRRPTGGRAVLHDDDITYSCIFPHAVTSMGTSIAQTYAIITRCLIDGLKRCSIPCDTHDSYDEFRELKREIKLPCFLSPNRDEVMVGGRKLVGSAQKRTIDGVLQHGSIPLSCAYRRLPEYLQIDDKSRRVQKRALEAKSISINEVNPEISPQKLIGEIIEAFIANLPFEQIVRGGWSHEEFREINAVAQSPDFVQSFL